MKKTISISLVVLLAAALLAGCGSGYKITVGSGADLLDHCPKSAEAGETVTVTTMCVTDADMFVRVNGDPDFGHFVRDGEYEFVMPAEDVEISIVVVSNGLA